MKKITAFFSAILLLSMSFVGCSLPQNPSVEGGTATTPPEAVTNAPELPQKPRKLLLGGVDISKYKIVYALNAAKPFVIGQSSSYWSDDYDAELQTAKRLSEMLKTYFGVELEIGLDMSTKKSEYEILIGATNRTESKTADETALAVDDYEIKMYGTKLVVRGGAYGSMYHGLDSLEKWFQSEPNDRLYNMTDGNPITGSYQLKHVACIGDSITEGYSASNRKYLSWVADLGRMCWQEYEVFNYGRGSKTMRSDFVDSYQACEQWSQCLANEAKYDVVLIMLGTNDSNRDRDWTAQDDATYMRDARAIIDRVKAHSPNAEFVIMNCPVYYGSANYGAAYVRAVQRTLVDVMLAEGYAIHFYDMYTYTSSKLGIAMFPDKLHPDDQGHIEVARGIAEMLKLLKEGRTNQYLLK